MLDIGFSEILLIFVLGLIVLGPQKLPRVAAQVGRWIGRARAMARQFREQLEEEINVEETRKKSPKPSTTTGDDGQGGSGPGTSGGSGASGIAGAAGAASGAAQATGPGSPGAETAGEGAGSPKASSADAPHLDLTNEPWPYVAPVPPPEVTDIFSDVLKTPVPGATTAPAEAQAGAATAASGTQAGASEGAAGSGASRVAPPESAPSAQVQWPHDHEVSEAAPEHVSPEAPVSTHERGP